MFASMMRKARSFSSGKSANKVRTLLPLMTGLFLCGFALTAAGRRVANVEKDILRQANPVEVVVASVPIPAGDTIQRAKSREKGDPRFRHGATERACRRFRTPGGCARQDGDRSRRAGIVDRRRGTVRHGSVFQDHPSRPQGDDARGGHDIVVRRPGPHRGPGRPARGSFRDEFRRLGPGHPGNRRGPGSRSPRASLRQGRDDHRDTDGQPGGREPDRTVLRKSSLVPSQPRRQRVRSRRALRQSR